MESKKQVSVDGKSVEVEWKSPFFRGFSIGIADEAEAIPIHVRLNLLSGASPWMAESADASDVFLEAYPPGSNPRGRAKQEATALKNELESAYETASCEGE